MPCALGHKARARIRAPACYGRGGTRPTVTDAHLVLGRLPTELANGALAVDRGKAEQAIQKEVADPLGLSLMEAAEGILRIANANIVSAIRVKGLHLGVDPRELAIVAYGGAGPMHAAEIAMASDIRTVVVPSMPGVLSALGFLMADMRYVFSKTSVSRISSCDPRQLTSLYEELEAKAQQWLEGQGIPPDRRRVERNGRSSLRRSVLRDRTAVCRRIADGPQHFIPPGTSASL